MDGWTDCYDALAGLLGYPDEATAERARAAVDFLAALAPDLAPPLSAFAAFTASRSATELEELFIRTFDLNPTCALEVGWHLYGEEYLRGAFLVRMRAEQRQHGVAETTELADHLAPVLALTARMERAAANDFARCCVIPAVDCMRQKLADAANPYCALLGTIQAVLEQRHAREGVTVG